MRGDLASRSGRRRGTPPRPAGRPVSHEPRVERVALLEPLRGRPSSRPRTGCSRSPPGCRARRPASCSCTIGSTAGSKNSGSSRAEQGVERSRRRGAGSARRRSAAAARPRRERLGRARQHELARRQVVERAGVDPEQLRVALDLGQRGRIDAGRVRTIALEHVAHLEAVRVALVVEDVAARERRLVQVPGQDLLVGAAAPRSRRHRAGRRRLRRRARAGRRGRSCGARGSRLRAHGSLGLRPTGQGSERQPQNSGLTSCRLSTATAVPRPAGTPARRLSTPARRGSGLPARRRPPARRARRTSGAAGGVNPPSQRISSSGVGVRRHRVELRDLRRSPAPSRRGS